MPRGAKISGLRGSGMVLGLLVSCTAVAFAAEPCRIEVVDRENGWPVPMVELRTVHDVRFVADNAGIIAFDLPELMGKEVWFEVRGDGYKVAEDGLGFRGIRLKPEPGATLRVELERTMPAKRLGRLTGAGLFAESIKCGSANGRNESGVLGCDSVQVAAHRGKLYWFWGDTKIAASPLGIFHATGATTQAGALEPAKPPLRPDFDYFRDDSGDARAVAKLAGEGATWLTGVASLPDQDGEVHLVATYMKVKSLGDTTEWGLAVWDEEKKEFAIERVLWRKPDGNPEPSLLPSGHAVFTEGEDGRRRVLFGHPFPALECSADFESWRSPEKWQPLQQPDHFTAAADRRQIKPHKGPHSGSIAWNEFRKRWIAVFLEDGGEPSPLGQIWYAEADEPAGPWGPAVKVLSHERHTFYNPRLHPEIVPPTASYALFEGTYTAAFAKDAEPTPRYDYNQILYRLDLDDPALRPAQSRKMP